VIVNKVVPSLIKNGKYDHSWLGISGMDMRPELATPMKLNSDQRGVLVEEVTAGGPADKAGIKASAQQITLDGEQINVGGDVIVGVDGNTVNSFSDLVTYLARNTEVNQKITLSLLRDGKVASADVTLGARPDSNTQVASSNSTPQQNNNPTQQQGSGWLGISGYTLTSEVNQSMQLSADQKGVLVVRVQSGSPAEKAGLHGGTQPMLAGGQPLLIGGDVITGIDAHAITSMEDLQALIAQTQPGQEITLSILRNGKAMDLKVTVGTAPAN
jgi:S1-C subfamily serine protease